MQQLNGRGGNEFTFLVDSRAAPFAGIKIQGYDTEIPGNPVAQTLDGFRDGSTPMDDDVDLVFGDPFREIFITPKIFEKNRWRRSAILEIGEWIEVCRPAVLDPPGNLTANEEARC